jgi:hypothetical protein
MELVDKIASGAGHKNAVIGKTPSSQPMFHLRWPLVR